MTSGLQKQVLNLYKRCLRSALAKPLEQREEAFNFVREEFRRGANTVKKSDFRTIEYMLRNGEKKLKIYSRPGTVGFGKMTLDSSDDKR